MAGEDGRGRRSGRTVVVILVLCLLAPSLNSFSLKGLSEKNKPIVSDVRTGSIFFNGKELKSHSTLVALDQTNGVLEQNSQLEEVKANEAAWRRLDSVLHCGHNKMKLKAMGPGVTDLQLDMGNAHPLSLVHVPETCGYSVKQNSLGLVLVVPYDGCNVQQEDGSYVLMMRWRGTAVKFTCPMSTSDPTPVSTTSKPDHQQWRFPIPHGSRHLNRHKRATDQVYDAQSVQQALWYNYYMYLLALACETEAETTAQPPTTTPPTTTYPPGFYYPQYPDQYPLGQLQQSAYAYYYNQYPQDFSGKNPYPKNPIYPPQTTTAKPTTTTTTTTTTTAAPTTTTAAPTTPELIIPPRWPTDGKNPYFASPYIRYHDLPFVPPMFANKASKFPDDQKYMPSPGFQPRSGTHPGFQHWPPVPWLSPPAGN